jgi:hypothetical protein
VGGPDWRTRVRLAVDESGRLGFRKHRSHLLELGPDHPARRHVGRPPRRCCSLFRAGGPPRRDTRQDPGGRLHPPKPAGKGHARPITIPAIGVSGHLHASMGTGALVPTGRDRRPPVDGRHPGHFGHRPCCRRPGGPRPHPGHIGPTPTGPGPAQCTTRHLRLRWVITEASYLLARDAGSRTRLSALPKRDSSPRQNVSGWLSRRPWTASVPAGRPPDREDSPPPPDRDGPPDRAGNRRLLPLPNPTVQGKPPPLAPLRPSDSSAYLHRHRPSATPLERSFEFPQELHVNGCKRLRNTRCESRELPALK